MSMRRSLGRVHDEQLRTLDPGLVDRRVGGRRAVRSASSGPSSSRSPPCIHAASSSGPPSTTGMRSWTGAQTAFAVVVRIVADGTHSPSIFVRVAQPGEREQLAAVDAVVERHARLALLLRPQPLVPAVGDDEAAPLRPPSSREKTFLLAHRLRARVDHQRPRRSSLGRGTRPQRTARGPFVRDDEDVLGRADVEAAERRRASSASPSSKRSPTSRGPTWVSV